MTHRTLNLSWQVNLFFCSQLSIHIFSFLVLNPRLPNNQVFSHSSKEKYPPVKLSHYTLPCSIYTENNLTVITWMGRRFYLEINLSVLPTAQTENINQTHLCIAFTPLLLFTRPCCKSYKKELLQMTSLLKLVVHVGNMLSLKPCPFFPAVSLYLMKGIASALNYSSYKNIGDHAFFQLS